MQHPWHPQGGTVGPTMSTLPRPRAAFSPHCDSAWSWLSWGLSLDATSVAPPCLLLGSPEQPRGLPNLSLGVGESRSPFRKLVFLFLIHPPLPWGPGHQWSLPVLLAAWRSRRTHSGGSDAGHQQGEMAKSFHVISIETYKSTRLPSESVKMGGGGSP